MSSNGVDAIKGNGEAAQGLVPKLRFPEFRGAGAWLTKSLDDICTIRGGATPDTNSPDFWDGGVPWITPAEMGKTSLPQISKTRRTISQRALISSASPLLRENSVILSTRAPIGLLAINTVPMSFNQGCRGLMPKAELDTYFLYSTLTNQTAQLNSLGAGSTFKELSGSALARFAIQLPPDTVEQKKIADCLSSLDAVIATEGERLAALRNHKKGLMQALFPAPGKTVPRFRFPEFQKTGQWDEKPLSACIELVSGLHLSPEDYSDAGEVPYFSGPSDLTAVQSDVSKWTSNAGNLALKGDILLVVKGSGAGDFFRLAISRVAIGRQLMAIRATAGQQDFLFQALATKADLLKARATGNLIPGLARPDILNLTVFFPPTEEEQGRVAKTLSSVDSRIAASIEKLRALKAHKSGLMQRLFPTPAELIA